MLSIKSFTFNPFQENTYLVYDPAGKETVIIDPGCMKGPESERLFGFIAAEGLKPVQLVNTHCHIDHIFGNRAVSEKYGLELYANPIEKDNIQRSELMATAFGVPAPDSPEPVHSLHEGDTVQVGRYKLQVLFTPGHSAGHVVFYNPEGKFVIGGDVLFRESIGRTDLPGGSFEVLIRSIREKLFPLGDDVKVYPGHGPATTIGYEREHNPFINADREMY